MPKAPICATTEEPEDRNRSQKTGKNDICPYDSVPTRMRPCHQNYKGMVGTEEVAKIFGCERRTIYRYVEEGLIAYRIGGEWKFWLDDVYRFIEERRYVPEQEA